MLAATDILVQPEARLSAHTGSLRDRRIWRDTTILWLATRLLFVALTYFGQTYLFLSRRSSVRISWDLLLRPWLGWDGANYAVIAREGYVHRWETAFFPLFPLLEHLLAIDLLRNPAATAVVGAVIANLAALGAFGLLRLLVERELGRAVSQRTLLYLAIFPTAFFFAASYTESLFLLLSIGAFLCLRRGRWLPAGLLAGLATLTRPVGILLLVPLAVECVTYVRQQRVTGERLTLRKGAAILGGLALPAIALGGFSLYQRFLFGTFSATTNAQANGGGRDFALPVIGFARAGAALLHDGFTPNYQQAHILVDGAFTLLLITLAVMTWRRLPLSYTLYSWAMVFLVLATPAHNWYALSSNMRYMLVVFPLFMLLGIWGTDRRVERIIIAFSLPLLALFTVAFLHGWVA